MSFFRYRLFEKIDPMSLRPDEREHRANAMLHARNRARTKYGLEFGQVDVERHTDMIRNNEAVLLGTSGELRGGHVANRFYEIKGEFREFYAVYNVKLDCIVTYLRNPHEWLGKRVKPHRARPLMRPKRLEMS